MQRSSLNRHMRQVHGPKKPVAEVDIASPSGDSHVSALANPEYIPNEFRVARAASASVEPSAFGLGMLNDDSPWKPAPKRARKIVGDFDAEESDVGAMADDSPNFERNDGPNFGGKEATNFSTRKALEFMDEDDDEDDDLSDDLPLAALKEVQVDMEAMSLSDSESGHISFELVNDLDSEPEEDRIRSTKDVDIFEEDSDLDSLDSGASDDSDDSSVVPNLEPRCGSDAEEEQPEPQTFYKPMDFNDVSEAVNSSDPEDLRIEEELLMHIIKEEHLPPRVFDRIMKWAKFSHDREYDFVAPGYRTVMKRWKAHYGNSALKKPKIELVQEEWQSVPSQVPVMDPLPQIMAILNDAELLQGALWRKDDSRATDGSKLYGDVNTGSQWHRGEDRMLANVDKENDPYSTCHHLCPILAFDDNTLGDGLGRLQIQPVLATLCIIPKKSRRTVKAWMILGIVPPYPRTSKERTSDRNKNKTRHQYLKWYHACLEKIWAPVKKLCDDLRGKPFTVAGTPRILHFELAGIIGDTKGHAEMCANYNAHSSVISKCNRDCNIPQAVADNPYYACARTLAQDVYDVINDALVLLQTTGKENKEARDECKRQLQAISQHPVLPYYSQYGFCGDPEGVFGSTPWELLHVWYLGLMKLLLAACYNISRTNPKLINWYRHRLEGHTKGDLSFRPPAESPKNSVLFPKPKFEGRMRFIQSFARRQSDRAVPRGPFREGVTDLTRLSGQEYPGLTLYSMICFKGIFHGTKLEAAEGVEFTTDLEQRMSLLCFLALSLDVEMSAEELSETQRSRLEDRLQLFLDFFRRTVGIYVEYGSQTGLRRPKVHAPLHLVREVIQKFGSTTNTFGGYLESFLKSLVKEPLKRTSRKHDSFQKELMDRYSEEQVRRASAERLKARGINPSEATRVSSNQTDSGSGSASSRMTNTTPQGRWFTPGGTVFSCKKDKVTGKWNTYDSKGQLLLQQGAVHHPGYPGNAAAKKWVLEMTKAADNQSSLHPDTVDYERIDFTYHMKVPNALDDKHDLFRCHPNYHGTALTDKPWHDWAMLKYEVENRKGEVATHEVAGKVLLWGVFRNSKAPPSSHKLDAFGVFHPMKEHKPKKDEILPFCFKDVLAKDIEVLPFDAVLSTAFVLPINWTRASAFPTSAADTKAFCIVPPRSKWPSLGWDHRFLKPTNMKDTKKLHFI